MSEQRGEFDAMRLWTSATEADRDQDPFLEKFEPEPPREVNRGRAVFELPEGIGPGDVVIFYDGSVYEDPDFDEKSVDKQTRIVNGSNIIEIRFRNGKVYVRGRRNSEIRFIPASTPNEATLLEVSFPKMDGTQDDPKPDSEDPDVKILR